MSREAWIAVLVLGGLVAAATVVGVVVLGIRVFSIRRMLGELGVGGKVAFYGAIAYTIFPIDLLPDPIYLDDMGVLAASAYYLTRLLHRRRAERATALAIDPELPPQRAAGEFRRAR
jgi:hypothetical protein